MDNTMAIWQQLILLLGPIAVIWPLTILLYRLASKGERKISPQICCFRAGGLTFLAAASLWVWFWHQSGTNDALELAGGLAFMAGYCFCCNFLNWFIYTVTETSMHTHLLVEIGRDPEGIPLDVLNHRYNKQAILRARVPRLVELGQLRLENGRLLLNGRWVLVGAEICERLRILLNIQPRPVQENE